MDTAELLVAIVCAYFVGAIPFGLIVARWFGIADIRVEGSGNIGATNVFRVAGPKAAFWVYLLDIGKGVAVVLAATGVDQALLSRDVFLICCALAAVLGHMFPVYIGFRGGKGVNTALGAMLVLLPVESIICVAVFSLVVLASRYVSLGSIAAALALPVIILAENSFVVRPKAPAYLYMSLAVAALILVAHRQNIRRFLSGTENRFTLTRKADKVGTRG